MPSPPLRTLFAVLLLLPSAWVRAQGCATPPSCIINSEIQGTGGGDMNSGAPFDVEGWFVSHGNPTLFTNDSPSNSTGCSIWMWSYGGAGEGVFTCYDFQQGQDYQVCLWVRNTNGSTAGGRLQVWMTNTTNPAIDNPFVLSPDSILDGQLVDDSWENDEDWTQLTFQVTPDADYRRLLIFPYRTSASMGFGDQYELQIDDIRVSPLQPDPGSTLTITSDAPSIAWCDSAQLCLNGVPPGASVTWSPAQGLFPVNDSCVRVSPCSSAVYSASVSVVAGCPNGCSPTVAQSDTVSVSVTVITPVVATLEEGSGLCGEPQLLRALVPEEVCGTGGWLGADGSASSSDTLVIDPLTPASAGIHTYRITHPSGLCVADAASAVITPSGTTADQFLPNAFTPNGDGINDVFAPVSAYGFAEFRLLVFDRWGGLLREIDDAQGGWDGTAGGSLVPGGVYAWRVEYVLSCSTRRERASGHVVALR